MAINFGFMVIIVKKITESNRASNIRKITITKILIGYYTLSIAHKYSLKLEMNRATKLILCSRGKTLTRMYGIT